MPILYSVIARSTTVLAKYASCAGNFAEVTESIMAKIPPDNSKMTYSHGSYLFHYICENRIIYMCITDDVRFSSLFSFVFVIPLGLTVKYLYLGIWAFPSISLPEWSEAPFPDYLWVSSWHSNCLFYEQWFCPGYGPWNGILQYFHLNYFLIKSWFMWGLKANSMSLFLETLFRFQRSWHYIPCTWRIGRSKRHYGEKHWYDSIPLILSQKFYIHACS